MNKEEVQKRVLKNGEPLDLNRFEWYADTNTFSTEESGLVLDFKYIDGCNFITDGYCEFVTGDDCSFKTLWNCKFDTGINCKFDTGDYCSFKTDSFCDFKTGRYCDFNTSRYCVFRTWDDCNFKTNDSCTFKTGNRCSFQTNLDCVFNTGSSCNFNTYWNCVFKTLWNCTFKTGNRCSFKTGDNCRFDTGDDCEFNTDNSCTFKTGKHCVIITRHTGKLEIIKPKKGVELQLAPYGISGYIKNGIYSRTGKLAIICDDILSEYTNKKVVNGLEVYKIEDGYIIKDGDISAHGKTIKKCKEDLKYKISNRDTSEYKNYTLKTIVSQKEAIRMYRVITGACEFGTKRFCKSINLKKEYSIQEIIGITKGQYGYETFKKFFIKK